MSKQLSVLKRSRKYIRNKKMWNKLEILKLNKTKCNHEIKLARTCTGTNNTRFLCAFLSTTEHVICFLLLLAMHIY